MLWLELVNEILGGACETLSIANLDYFLDFFHCF